MKALGFVVLTGQFTAGKDTQAAILEERLGNTSEAISTKPVIILKAK